jgi:hypothetical protein
MSTNAGNLLWNRIRATIPAGVNGGAPGVLDIDTGLRQVNQNFVANSVAEPGFTDPSRVQVMPMSPISAWTFITHGEPTLSAVTNTIHVIFSNDNAADAEINVLFWDPHTLAGPGDADTYNAP